MMRVAIVGYGRMGSAIAALCEGAEDAAVAGIVDPAHLPSLADVPGASVAVDFSYPGDLHGLLADAVARGIPLVIGRTGLTDAMHAAIDNAARHIPIVQAGNFSIGITVLRQIAAETAAALGDGYDIEIIETHHRGKRDAPSGTAQMLRDAVDPGHSRPQLCGREGGDLARGREIGMHSLRGGTITGEHTLLFLGDGESLALTHRAEDRRVFAAGALRAARFAASSAPGRYTMRDVLFGPLPAKGGA